MRRMKKSRKGRQLRMTVKQMASNEEAKSTPFAKDS